MILTLPSFEKRGGIQRKPIRTLDKLMSQMRAIVERESTPSVMGIIRRLAQRRQGTGQLVQSVIVACSTINNIPGGSGVVESIGVGNGIENWSKAFEDVDMSKQNEVDVVLIKDFFKGLLAIQAR